MSHQTKARSGFRNVYKVNFKTPSPYWAYVTIDKKKVGLGNFRKPEKAYEAVLKAKEKLERGEKIYGRYCKG